MLSREEGRSAEFRHIRQQRSIDAACEFAEHALVGQRLWKDRVGACGEIGLGALDCAVEAFARRRVRAGDDVKVATRARGGGDLGGHVVATGDLFVGEMTAFLGQDLVFEVDGACASVLKATHHVHDIERFAIAGVAIDEDWQPRCP